MSIRLENVHKYYNRGEPNEVHALIDVSLSVEKGEMICLQGPSGSGKSTLLSIIGCLFPPTSGGAAVFGKQLSRMPDHFLTLHRRNYIGFIFQRYNLLEPLSVIDNITVPLLPLGISPKKRKTMARVLLEKLNISHRETFPVNKISGGEMQRVAIARALICDPLLVLADEPTAHLDTSLSLRFMEAMADLKKEGKTVVITSHDPLIQDHPIIDSHYSIDGGRVTRSKKD